MTALGILSADPRIDSGHPARRHGELLDRWQGREEPLDLFEVGAGTVADEVRGDLVLTAVQIALPWLEQVTDQQLGMVGATVWALDAFCGRDERLAAEAANLRRSVLAPLVLRRPPPPTPASDDPQWVDVPAGSFWIGSYPSQGREGEKYASERPRHRVTLSAFRMLDHEVSNDEYRQLVPEHAGDGPLPASNVSWRAAYAYSAWLGGRLPTEAEWEYASRAGCAYNYCDRAGRETTVDETGWYRRNASAPETLQARPQPVRQFEPNPCGLFDMYGNYWERTADWFGDYSGEAQIDPWGPLTGGPRVMRGGSYLDDISMVCATYRFGYPSVGFEDLGFRPVLPPTPPRGEDAPP